MATIRSAVFHVQCGKCGAERFITLNMPVNTMILDIPRLFEAEALRLGWSVSLIQGEHDECPVCRQKKGV